MDRPSLSALDPLLVPFVTARGPGERERACADLLSGHAEPVASRVVRRRLRLPAGDPDAEDVKSEVLLELTARLESLREHPGERPIGNLAGYVAVMAYHACDRYVRRRRPARWRLKNRVRYALSHVAGLAQWEDEGEWHAGLAEWRGGGPEGRSGRLEALRRDPREATSAALDGTDARALPPGEVLRRVLRWLGRAAPVDDLVDAVAVVWPLEDDAVDDGARAEPAVVPALDAVIDRRRRLERLWVEIRELPPRQRVALLLNLRDEHGGDLLGALTLTGIARLREIAAVLEMDAAELARLWKDLPLEDAVLARRLGVSRQQVINLRKSARERLARRLRAVELAREGRR